MDYQNYINGEWRAARSGERMETLEPATGEVLGTVPLSQPEDVDAAVRAAHEAFKSWRLVPAPERGEMLFRVAEGLKRRKEEISRFLSREMGKVLPEARGDVQEAIDMAYYMGGEGRRLFGKVAPSEMRHKAAWAQREPIGVVGMITPWNFPVAIPAWKMFPALVCGNTVVFKPAEDTPMLAAMFIEVMEEAGFPAGVVNMVTGDGPTTGNAIVEHPDVKVISFTGSAEVGKIVASKGGAMLKKVSLELGGKNAVIVMDDANLDLVLDATIWGAFGTTGQRCTATSRVIVNESVRARFTEALVERTRQLRLGHGGEETTDVGPLINQAALDKVISYEQVAREQGARVLVWWRAPREWRRLLLPANHLGQRRGGLTAGAGGDLRPLPLHHRLVRHRGRDPEGEWDPVRAELRHLHAGREPRLPRHPRPGGGPLLHQPLHDRRGNLAALRRG